METNYQTQLTQAKATLRTAQREGWQLQAIVRLTHDVRRLEGLAHSVSVTCPLAVGSRRPVPSNRQALADARRLMSTYAGTEFGASKVDRQWVVVRYA